jgi:zinc/manganese transport system substrate-binding protein
MKKFFLILSLLFFSFPVHAKISVVATLPVFASLAREVGGERVEVSSLARPNQDPHFLDAKPSYVVALNRADLLIFGGLDLEVGWLPSILTQARNPKILPGNPGNVNAAQGLSILEIPKTPMDRSFGDVHPLGNPHTWLDPRNAKIIAANIYLHLGQVDPAGDAYYKDRLKAWLAQLDQKIAEWSNAAGLRGKKVLTYHRSFSYFADWTGLIVAGTSENKPGIPPSSKHVDVLIKLVPQEEVRAVLMEDFYPKKVPQYLAEKTALPLLILPTQTGEAGSATYFELIDSLVHEIEKAVGSPS